MIPQATSFLRKVLSAINNAVKSNAEVPDVLFETLLRIFDGDPRCKRFYNKYGLAVPKDKSLDKDGNFAKRPVCLAYFPFLLFAPPPSFSPSLSLCFFLSAFCPALCVCGFFCPFHPSVL